MATGDGGLLVLGGSSGSLVVSLHGLVVSVVSCSSLPRPCSSPPRLLLGSPSSPSRIWPVQALLTGAPTNQPDNQWEHPGSDQWGVANRRVSLMDRDESVHLSPPCDHPPPPRHWLDSAGGHPHGHQVCTLVCTDIHTNIISRCTHT